MYLRAMMFQHVMLAEALSTRTRDPTWKPCTRRLPASTARLPQVSCILQNDQRQEHAVVAILCDATVTEARPHVLAGNVLR